MPHKSVEARREYRRKWYAANKARHVAHGAPSAARRKADPEWRARRREYEAERHQKNLEERRRYALARYHENRESRIEKMREWTARHPDRARNAMLKRKYGMTIKDWDKMFADQGGVCAACGGGATRSKNPWHVDHCHQTGKVRAILCHGCNTAAGLARDDPARLRALADYLDRFRVELVKV